MESSVEVSGMEVARQVLSTQFGFQHLRDEQASVLQALIERDESAAAIFPTGGGKSLCYQLPAMVWHTLARQLPWAHDSGLTLVVCPLIALMKDQVDFLRKRRIPAAYINSTLPLPEVHSIYRQVHAGELQLLYVAPERFRSEEFMKQISKVNIDLFAIDEAHCISEWGHAFRPDYLELPNIAAELGAKRILAVTATATPRVASDMIRAFGIPARNLVRSCFHRPNLHLSAHAVWPKERQVRILDSLRKDHGLGSIYRGATIVYCTTHKQCESMAEFLNKHGYQAAAYHAGMQNTDRTAVQNWFMEDNYGEPRVVCATIAFGMGMDKRDVRCVYHAYVAKSLEGYSQEIGRGGRDGAPSICRCFICTDDLPLLRSFANSDTPSLGTVQALLKAVFYQGGRRVPKGEIVEISHFDIGKQLDLKSATINVMLCHLKTYGGWLKPLPGVRRDKMMNRYKILRPPDATEFGAVAMESYGRQQKKEEDEIRRLDEVLDLFQARECHVQALVGHFGGDVSTLEDEAATQKAGWRCGHCQSCRDAPVRLMQCTSAACPEKAKGRIDESIDKLFGDRVLAQISKLDDYRTGVRYLTGMSGAALSALFRTSPHLRRDPLFGALSGLDFNAVLGALHARVGRRAVHPAVPPPTPRAPATTPLADMACTPHVRAASAPVYAQRAPVHLPQAPACTPQAPANTPRAAAIMPGAPAYTPQALARVPGKGWQALPCESPSGHGVLAATPGAAPALSLGFIDLTPHGCVVDLGSKEGVREIRPTPLVVTERKAGKRASKRPLAYGDFEWGSEDESNNENTRAAANKKRPTDHPQTPAPMRAAAGAERGQQATAGRRSIRARKAPKRFDD